jgi:Fe-S-cluster containining protein
MINEAKLREEMEFVSSLSNDIKSMAVMSCLFKCQQCGKCCNDIDGVSVDKEDIKRISNELGHGINWFMKNMIEDVKHPDDGVYFLKDTKLKRRCIFYDNGCTIYSKRPKICRCYPCFNADDNGMRFHMYTTCPGSVSLAKEILYYKTHVIDPSEPMSTDEMTSYGIIVIAAYIHVCETSLISKDLKKEPKKVFPEIMKMINLDKIDISTGNGRAIAMSFLARYVHNIEEFFTQLQNDKK